jgi:hypothetical protein
MSMPFMVVKNEFSLVKLTILRVKKHKTCKIGFKTRKPVKSVKPGQTRIKSGQPVKNVKSVSISRFHVKLKFKRVCHLSCWIVDCCAYADSSLPSPNSQCPLPTPHSPPVTRHSTVHPSSLPLSLSPFPFPLSTLHQIKIKKSVDSVPLSTESTHQQRCLQSPLSQLVLLAIEIRSVLGETKVRIYSQALFFLSRLVCE